MSIQITGQTPINFTFTSTGTRANLFSNFQTQIVAAGWTVAAGSGSDITFESATTPQGIKIRVEVIDPGSGNCIQFKLKDNTTLVGPTTMFLLPINGALFRIWANKYQFFYFLSGTDLTKPRAFVCGGVPWVPPFIQAILTTAYAGWLHGNGTTDTDANDSTSCWRSRFTADRIHNYSAIWNGVVFGSTSVNAFGLLIQTGETPIDDMWEEGTFTLFETVLVWQSASFPNPVRHGCMWDAALTTKPLNSELMRTFGGITWLNVTHQNQTSGGIGRGCLMLLLTPS